ncbi:MAG: HU family DNA-binding protein [Candidatus Coproplasma sp.]
MNKTELVKVVAEKAGMTQAVAADAVNAMVDVIVEKLIEGDEVAILGFGAFKVADRPARTARNPQTGETVEVPASKAVTFKVSKSLKEKLN